MLSFEKVVYRFVRERIWIGLPFGHDSVDKPSLQCPTYWKLSIAVQPEYKGTTSANVSI